MMAVLAQTDFGSANNISEDVFQSARRGIAVIESVMFSFSSSIICGLFIYTTDFKQPQGRNWECSNQVIREARDPQRSNEFLITLRVSSKLTSCFFKILQELHKIPSKSLQNFCNNSQQSSSKIQLHKPIFLNFSVHNVFRSFHNSYKIQFKGTDNFLEFLNRII